MKLHHYWYHQSMIHWSSTITNMYWESDYRYTKIPLWQRSTSRRKYGTLFHKLIPSKMTRRNLHRGQYKHLTSNNRYRKFRVFIRWCIFWMTKFCTRLRRIYYLIYRKNNTWYMKRKPYSLHYSIWRNDTVNRNHM